jgi:hypothetical protein
MKSGGWRNSLTAPQSHAELDSLWGRAFNIVIAGRAAGTPTHISHAGIRRLPAVSLRDRVKVGRGNLYAHVERAGLKGHSLSSAYGSNRAFRRIWHDLNPLIFMHFHVVLYGNQHEI